MAEFTNMPGMTKEMREGLVAAFDALSNWSDEIETVNERCLKKVLDQTSAVARSMGWPDQAVRMMREHLENASKAQTEIIDQIMEGWKQQLKSPTAPMAIPRNLPWVKFQGFLVVQCLNLIRWPRGHSGCRQQRHGSGPGCQTRVIARIAPTSRPQED